MLTGQNALAQPGAPLFSTHEPLELTLTAPMRDLVRGRARRPERDGVLAFAGPDGQPIELDLTVAVRGNSRVEICQFPPLWLDLKRRQLDGTVFEGQNRIKLVTRCGTRSEYRRTLELEYLAYRIYNELSDYSFRVRPVSMTYVDSERDGETELGQGFLIEPVDTLAERRGVAAVDVERIAISELLEPQLAMFWVFQYLIGNTDASALSGDIGDDCCHNGDVLRVEEAPLRYVVVPYDFDQSGLVDASYAAPAERLSIRTVRQRLYWGFCSSNEFLPAVIATVVAAWPRIEALVQTSALEADEIEDTLEFLRGGLEMLNDPEAVDRRLLRTCR